MSYEGKNQEYVPRSQILQTIQEIRSEWEKKESSPKFFHLAAARRSVLDALDRVEKVVTQSPSAPPFEK